MEKTKVTKRKLKIKQFLKSCYLLVFVSVIFGQSQLFSQVYLDTGHPNLEQLKEQNEGAKVEEKESPIQKSDSEKTEKPAEESTIKTSQESEAIDKKVTTPSLKTQPSEPITKEIKKEVKISSQDNKKPDNTKVNTGFMSGKSKFSSADLPPKAEAGKCYARCFIPDKYEMVEEQVIDKPVTFKSEVIPAIYKTVFDTIITKPEQKKTEVIPAVYDYVDEEVMISPAHQTWVKEKADNNCLLPNPEDCEVLKLVDVPAKYKTVKKQIVKTPSKTNEIIIPAEFKVEKKEVMVEPAKAELIEIPATYKTVKNKQLTKKGGYMEWKEVLCNEKINDEKVRQIQQKLKNLGYDPGIVDGDIGSKTKVALANFQEDKNLPSCNMNLETLKKLGVE